MGGSSLNGLAGALQQVGDCVNKPILTRIKAYDALAVSLAMQKVELRPLVDALLVSDCTDAYWNFFHANVQENQLARVDIYESGINYIQTPFWVALLCTKFNIAPVPLEPHLGRQAVPATVAGRRRMACGFMYILFPCMSMHDAAMRYAACLCAVRTCFKQTSAHAAMLRGLLEVITQQMLASKQIAYQVSALEMLGLIVRLKIPGISESILQEYVDLCLDFLHNTPTPQVKVGVLKLVEILVMVFPKGASAKFDEIRDIARHLLLDTDALVVDCATRVYIIVYRECPKQKADAFLGLAQSDLDTLLNPKSLIALADPLVNSVSADRSQRTFG